MVDLLFRGSFPWAASTKQINEVSQIFGVKTGSSSGSWSGCSSADSGNPDRVEGRTNFIPQLLVLRGISPLLSSDGNALQ